VSTQSTQIEIAFGKSSSAQYDKAVRLASKLPNFKTSKSIKDENEVKLSGEECRMHLKTIDQLLQIVGSWKSTRVKMNGSDISAAEASLAINPPMSCYTKYLKTVRQDSYCEQAGGFENGQDKGWGCRLHLEIQLETPRTHYRFSPTRKTHWFQFGKLDSSGKEWIIDKKDILALLKAESKKRFLDLCPVYDFSMVENQVSKLPDKLSLEENGKWVLFTEEEDEGAFVVAKNPTVVPKSFLESRSHSLGINYPLNLGLVKQEKPSNKESQKVRNIPSVTFSEVGGIEGQLEQIRTVIELPMKRPDIFKHLGIAQHRGIILYGPPGCGKTLIAKAIANEIQAHFISVKGPEIKDKYVGQSEQNLRNIFDEAREMQPSIIFFDEIDSLTPTRTGDDRGLTASLVNQFLSLMDGIEEFGNVCVLASTNRLELIDPAILRPGRFDYKLEIPMPDLAGIRKILSILISKMTIASDFDAESFAAKLYGCSGADIAFVVREAGYVCIRRTVDVSKELREEEKMSVEKLNISSIDFNLALMKLTTQKT
jgi:transitional endoplasmic reticulum ATPase